VRDVGVKIGTGTITLAEKSAAVRPSTSDGFSSLSAPVILFDHDIKANGGGRVADAHGVHLDPEESRI
jgi:hypothetical protein